MKAYLDITLLPNDDIGHHFLWAKVYQQVHLALVENKNPDDSSSFGVSFPEFNETQNRLGRKLRLFAPDKAGLEELSIQNWLQKLHDYVHITHIRETPERIEGYVRFTRLHTKASKERLARRAVKRHGMTYEQALQERQGFQPELSNAPFIQLQSLGNGNRYRLFISRRNCLEPDIVIGKFNTYGLSKGQAVPCF